jgi:hypothetical protein
MFSKCNPQKLSKTIYSLLCFGFWAVSMAGSQEALSHPWTLTQGALTRETLAQGSIPSAGAVLGWELNMNRTYTPKLDPGVPASQTNSGQQAPVIFYDLKNWPSQPTRQDSPFLLNTPSPGK